MQITEWLNNWRRALDDEYVGENMDWFKSRLDKIEQAANDGDAGRAVLLTAEFMSVAYEDAIDESRPRWVNEAVDEHSQKMLKRQREQRREIAKLPRKKQINPKDYKKVVLMVDAAEKVLNKKYGSGTREKAYIQVATELTKSSGKKVSKPAVAKAYRSYKYAHKKS